MFKKFWYYIHIWYWHAISAIQVTFNNRWTNLLFFTGKFLRLAMSLIFLFVIKNNITTFGSYTSEQMLVFFLVYLWIDTTTQALYRGVYMFGQEVRNGNFDFDLMKPINPLFKALMGEPDINDVIFLIPTVLVSLWIFTTLHLTFSLANILLFIFLFLNSFVIATAFHIFIVSFAILTTDVDGVMWIYRDFLRLGQFPITIYKEVMRFALFFIIPIGMMITIPAEVLLNVTPTYALWLTVLITILFVTLSISLWNMSLKHYTSASS